MFVVASSVNSLGGGRKLADNTYESESEIAGI